MVDEKKREAGKKRWLGVSKSDRKATVTAAAHARWKDHGVVMAQAAADLTLGGVSLKCAVLEDERRVISERSLSEAIGYQRRPEDYADRRKALEAGESFLPVYISNERVRQFLSPEALERLSNPIRYRVTKGFGIPAVGVEATVLADICDAYVEAKESGVLTPDELPKAKAALLLLRSLAKVGIVALIDEATGFQVIRGRDELQKLLEQYVAEEFRPWTKTFPDAFYVELFRLRKLKMDDVRKRPQYFGKLTNDIVYHRLIPGICPRLNELNPSTNGRRKKTNTQFLEDQGLEHLKTHLAGTVMLMKSHDNYADFIKALDRAAPKQDRAIVQK